MFIIKKIVYILTLYFIVSCGKNDSITTHSEGLLLGNSLVFNWKSSEIEEGILHFSPALPFVSFNSQDLFPSINSEIFNNFSRFDMFHNSCEVSTVLSDIKNWYMSISQSATLWIPQSEIKNLSLCRLKKYLTCVHANLRNTESIVSRLVGENVSYRTRRDILAMSVGSFKYCRGVAQLGLRDWDLAGVHPDLPLFEPSFSISNNRIYFQPSPLSYIIIYEQKWEKYEDALIQAIPLATVPLVPNCENKNGACLESPLDISRCENCSQLKSGQYYRAFLIRGPNNPNTQILSALFKAQ